MKIKVKSNDKDVLIVNVEIKLMQAKSSTIFFNFCFDGIKMYTLQFGRCK